MTNEKTNDKLQQLLAYGLLAFIVAAFACGWMKPVELEEHEDKRSCWHYIGDGKEMCK